MTPKRKKRLHFALAIIVTASAVVGLVTYAFKENINLFFSASQIAAGEAPTARTIRVGGLVQDNSVKRDNDTLEVSFVVTDGLEDLKIYYQGILPDLFREGQGIVARGQIQEDGLFKAEEVLAKHDENYLPPEVAASLAGTMESFVPADDSGYSSAKMAGGEN